MTDTNKANVNKEIEEFNKELFKLIENTNKLFEVIKQVEEEGKKKDELKEQ